ncbi:hypothetical protein HMPREF2534_00331 [Bacteroides thetaiotaomicron]|jgi:hypothetical protein|nr:hypothetical protein HMPREF2534_00331 [Bacteroides thetaiotaomicron]
MKMMFGRLVSSFFWLAQEARLSAANGSSKVEGLLFMIEITSDDKK